MATHSKMVSSSAACRLSTSSGSHCDLWSNYHTARGEGALQRDKSVSRLMRDILTVAASMCTHSWWQGPESGLKMKLQVMCQLKLERGRGVYGGLEGIVSWELWREECPKLRFKMKVKQRMCWFSNWDLKITLPSNNKKEIKQCLRNLSTNDTKTRFISAFRTNFVSIKITPNEYNEHISLTSFFFGHDLSQHFVVGWGISATNASITTLKLWVLDLMLMISTCSEIDMLVNV